jgi:triosephosphate isomerase
MFIFLTIIMIKRPMIVVNMKAYERSIGENGYKLAMICEEVAEENDVGMVVSPQQVDLSWIAKSVNIPCLAQHVDAVEPDSKTGWITPESIKSSGAVGSLVNHAEHRLKTADTDFIIEKCKRLDLISIVCTNNVSVSAAIAALKPYAIAIEPPELIGSGIPVSKAEPEIVEDAVRAVKRVQDGVIVLCGAGISNGEDVKASIELGTEGVLLASAVVNAKDPKERLIDLVSKI